jgi:hypothetical protein
MGYLFLILVLAGKAEDKVSCEKMKPVRFDVRLKRNDDPPVYFGGNILVLIDMLNCSEQAVHKMPRCKCT